MYIRSIYEYVKVCFTISAIAFLLGPVIAEISFLTNLVVFSVKYFPSCRVYSIVHTPYTHTFKSYPSHNEVHEFYVFHVVTEFSYCLLFI